MGKPLRFRRLPLVQQVSVIACSPVGNEPASTFPTTASAKDVAMPVFHTLVSNLPITVPLLIVAVGLLGGFGQFVRNTQLADLARLTGHTAPSVLTGLLWTAFHRTFGAVIVAALAGFIGYAEHNPSFIVVALLFFCLYELGMALQCLFFITLAKLTYKPKSAS
jgi:hypothetical protein